MKIRTTQKTVMPDNAELYDPRAFTVGIEDEGGGEFLRVSSVDGDIKIDPDEWPALETAISDMMEQIAANGKKEDAQ